MKGHRQLNKIRKMIHEQNENIMRQKLLENPKRNSGTEKCNNWIEKITTAVQQKTCSRKRKTV